MTDTTWTAEQAAVLIVAGHKEIEKLRQVAAEREQQLAAIRQIGEMAERLARDELARRQERIDTLIDLVLDLTDSSPCQYDHNDCCQSHSLHSWPCPHELAKEVLGVLEMVERLKKEGQRG